MELFQDPKNVSVVRLRNTTSTSIPERIEVNYICPSKSMYVITLFPVSRLWNQPKCPSKNE